MKEEEKLKVSALVSFKKEDYDLANTTISSLIELTNMYSSVANTSDPGELEVIKRKFVAHMGTLTACYAKVKGFKGADHSYLSDSRKQFKAEALHLMINDPTESVRITAAKDLVYKSEYYIERIHLTEKIRSFFIKVDEYYEYFNTVLNLIQQTISIVSKDYEFNRYSKS